MPSLRSALRQASPLLLLALLLALSVPPPASTAPLHSTSQAPRVARIALLHMHDRIAFFRRLGKLTGENKQRYAERHGYDMIFSTPYNTSGIFRPCTCDGREGIVRSGPDAAGQCWTDDPTFDIDHTRAATFGKVRLALAACRGRDDAWLFWSDADALVVNQTVRLESVIDDAYDMILAYDWLMLNAGMLFVKCSPWSIAFLNSVYDARKFDSARALDQSSLQEHLDNLTVAERRAHLKVLPKYAMNVYTEEYRPGDFLVHFAGKLYEATEAGLFAIANQFDILSTVDDVEDIAAFFRGTHLLNYYSGTCDESRPGNGSCLPDDPRRITLHEPLGTMSHPRRYRHVGLRYYWLGNWEDKYDTPNWDRFSRPLASRTDPALHAQHPPEPPSAHHERNPSAHHHHEPQAQHDAREDDTAPRDEGVQDNAEGETKAGNNDDNVDLPAEMLHHHNIAQPHVKDGDHHGHDDHVHGKEDVPEVAHDFDGGAEHAKKDDADDGQPDGDDDDNEESESSRTYGWVLLGAAGFGMVSLVLIMRRRKKVQSKKQ